MRRRRQATGPAWSQTDHMKAIHTSSDEPRLHTWYVDERDHDAELIAFPH